jgi:hypothetical protein
MWIFRPIGLLASQKMTNIMQQGAPRWLNKKLNSLLAKTTKRAVLTRTATAAGQKMVSPEDSSKSVATPVKNTVSLCAYCSF